MTLKVKCQTLLDNHRDIDASILRTLSAGTSAPSCAICGTVWMSTSQQRVFCIYVAYLWIGNHRF